MSTTQAGLSALWPLIRGLRNPILTTRRTNGGLQSRPVAMQNRETDRLDFLWFFIPADSPQVDDLQWDSAVSIVFADAHKAACVAVFGSAAVVDDTARKRVFWSAEAASRFTGPDDPELALVRVRIIQADHWEVERNAATPIFKLDNSVLTPKPASDRSSSGAMHH